MAFALVPATYLLLQLPHATPLAVETTGNSLFAAVSTLLMPIVGAAIVSRHPQHLVGWIYVLSGLLLATTFFTTAYAQYATQYPARLPARVVVDVISGLSFFGGFFLPITFGLLLFPDGRLVSRQWRPVAWLSGASLVLLIAQHILDEVSIGGPFTAPLTLSVFLASVSASAASVVVRWRRSHGVEREQLKWIGFAALLFLVIIGVDVGLSTLIPGFGDAHAFTVGTAGIALLPISIGIAILRYRLYEIDRIVTRTIGYAIVTATLLVVFAMVVVGLQALLAPFTRGDTVPVAASTLVVFALFQPLRRRVQSAIDRRFYRARYDGERTVAELARRLRDEVDLDAIIQDLRAVMGSTVQPRSASVWIRIP